MPTSCNHVYVHFVWATWDRQPHLKGEIRSRIYAVIAETCQKLHCLPMAIGGTDDHVHLLTRLHADVSIASLAHRIKGSSSHLIRRTEKEFRWQGSYGAFSLTASDVERVRQYVNNQEEHHATQRLWPRFERCEDGPS